MMPTTDKPLTWELGLPFKPGRYLVFFAGAGRMEEANVYRINGDLVARIPGRTLGLVRLMDAIKDDPPSYVREHQAYWCGPLRSPEDDIPAPPGVNLV